MTYDFVKFGGGTEEEGSVDLIYGYSGMKVEHFMLRHVGICGVELLSVYADGGVLRNSAQEEHYCKEKSDLDGDGEVEDDGEEEGDDEYCHVSFGIGRHADNGAPATHVVADHDEDGGETCHGDKIDEGHGEEEYEEEDEGVDHSGYGCLTSIGDIGHGAGDGAGDGDTAEDGDHDIGYTLSDKFGIGVGAVACASVGDGGGEERLDSAEHGDGEG